jgi:hypothetical protein
MPAHFYWFQLFYWSCVAAFCVLLLRVKDRGGRVSLAALLGLVTLVAVFIGVVSIVSR